MPRPHRLKALWRRATNPDLWVTLAPALIALTLAFGIAFYFVKPAPPKTVTLAMSEDEGGARYFARRYKDILARDGITLQLVPTAGSPANLAKLNDPGSGVDVAFVQSGVASLTDASNIVSLGSLSYTPLWVFYRGEQTQDLRSLKGRRIAVGQEQSGTQALTLELLKASGIDGPPTTLLSLAREEAIERLQRGELDAVMMVAPAESPFLKRLAASGDIKLLSLSRADAFVRRYPYLSRLTLPQGVFDLAQDVPPEDVVLLSPTAKLLARPSLHPALAYLLMRAATEVHSEAGILDATGEFPAAIEGGVPLSDEAKRYYKAGVPLLQRYLPFWAANLVDRLWLMLVPLIAVAVPLARLVPAAYQWRVRSRVFRWYDRLKEIEIELDGQGSSDPERLQDLIRRLEEIEQSVKQISTPLAYTENLYFFREHVDVVRRRLLRALEGAHSRPFAAAGSLG